MRKKNAHDGGDVGMLPTSGLHSVLLKSSLEFPLGGSPLTASSPKKPLTLLQPHSQQPVFRDLPTTRPPHPQEEEEETPSRQPSPAKLAPHNQQQKSDQQINLSSRPRQWMPTLLTNSQNKRTTNTLLISPRESSYIMAAARVVGEHGTPDVQMPTKLGGSHAEPGNESGCQQRRIASLLQALRDEQHDKSKLVVLLKTREMDIESLHQLLWHSQVAPSQGELSQIMLQAQPCKGSANEIARLTTTVDTYRKFLTSHGLVPPAVPSPAGNVEEGEVGEEGVITPSSARMLALEQQLVKYAKIIREQQLAMSSTRPLSPFETEVSQLRAGLQHKDEIISMMDQEMARKEEEMEKLQSSLRARDTILGERQAEIAAKKRRETEFDDALTNKDRCILWLRQLLKSLGHSAQLPSELERYARAPSQGGGGSNDDVSFGQGGEKHAYLDAASASSPWRGAQWSTTILPSSLSYKPSSSPNSRTPSHHTHHTHASSMDLLAMNDATRSPQGEGVERKKSDPLPPPQNSERMNPLRDWKRVGRLDTEEGNTPASSVRGTPPSSFRSRGTRLPSGDWDTAKAEVREQMRLLKNGKQLNTPEKDGVASCKLARMRQGLKAAPTRHDTDEQDDIVTM